MFSKAKTEHWAELKKRVSDEAERKFVDKASDILSDNATVAAEIKSVLLKKLRQAVLMMPDENGSESYVNKTVTSYDERTNRTTREDGGRRYRFRDFTLAYKDLTDDLPKPEDTTTMQKLDALLQEAMDAAYSQTS